MLASIYLWSSSNADWKLFFRFLGVIPVCDIDDDDEDASDVRSKSIFGRPEKKQNEDSDSDNDW